MNMQKNVEITEIHAKRMCCQECVITILIVRVQRNGKYQLFDITYTKTNLESVGFRFRNGPLILNKFTLEIRMILHMPAEFEKHHNRPIMYYKYRGDI